MTLQVTHAAPHPQGVPLRPTVGVVEAVVMTTMAAVPGMDMAVVTVIPAVGVTRTPLVVVTVWVGRREGHPLLLSEAIIVNTAARAVGRLEEVAGAAVEQIEEWPGTDTEMDSEEEKKIRRNDGFSLKCKKTLRFKKAPF